MASATVRVEKATSDLLIAPDWTLNIDICDSVNSDYGQAKDVIKAVKKRLHHKSPKVQFLTLTLLETLMKNCGDYVHQQVSEREILQDMVKIVKKKSDMQVREKILILLDSWQEAFGGAHGKFPQYYLAYAELKGAGVIFPERSSDDAPIITPPATHPSPSSFPIPRPPPQAIYNPQPGYGSPQPGYGFPQPGYGMPQPGYRFPQPGYGMPQPGFGMPVNASVRLDEAMASDRVNLSLSELDSMRSVMELLSEMLKAVNPTDHEAVKDEVISELVIQCRSNEKKLMAFINSTRDEQLLEQSLELNDKLQSLLAKHDSIASGSTVQDETRDVSPASDTVAPPVPSTSHVVATSGAGEDEEDDDDDEFAQLARRNTKLKAISTEVPSSPFSQPSTRSNGSGSSVPNNPLTLPEPPAPIKTSPNKEEEIINLLNLSLTLSPPIPNPNQIQNPSPTIQTTSPIINSLPSYPIQNPNQIQIQNPNPSPITSPTIQTSPVINSPPNPHQNQESSYNNTPWAPPQETSTNQISSPVTAPTTTNPTPNKENSYHIVQWAPPPPETSSYPPPPWDSEPDPPTNSNPPPLQYNLIRPPMEQFGSAGSIRVNALGAPPRPSYVSSNTFFGDLVELRNPDGSLRTSAAGFSGSPNYNYMNSGMK